jgi:hypothetical protein
VRGNSQARFLGGLGLETDPGYPIFQEAPDMFQIISIIILVVAVILSFIVTPVWSWVPVAILDLFILIQFLLVKQKYKFRHVQELSSEANFLLIKFGHYFAMPFASKDLGASAATSQFGGIIIAIMCAFKGFWFGIAFAVANWIIMGFVACSLSPASLLDKRPDLHSAHDEVMEFINSKRS